MERFILQEAKIAGVQILTRKSLGDRRGFFERMFCISELNVLDFKINQINRSFTHEKGSLRGMHYQKPPNAETKVVSCLRGCVFDVALDLRQGSPTFLHWHGEILSADNFKSMVIPKGVAHGFQTLDEDCELLYLHDAPYSPKSEGHINLFEELAGIKWPLPFGTISERDKDAPLLTEEFSGIKL